MPGLYRCGHCREEKPGEAFAPSQRKDGSWCRACFHDDYLVNREAKIASATERNRRVFGNPGFQNRDCEWCGSVFSTPYRRSRFCNRACKYAAAHAKRPSVNGGAMARITRGRLAKRDGWACGICGDTINQRVRYPDPLSASVDHRIPTAKGGSDSMDNLQLAHLRCNVRKSDRLVATNF